MRLGRCFFGIRTHLSAHGGQLLRRRRDGSGVVCNFLEDGFHGASEFSFPFYPGQLFSNHFPCDHRTQELVALIINRTKTQLDGLRADPRLKS